MARILALLCSGRRQGYTAQVMEAAVEGMRSVEGVEVEVVHAFRYRFAPCNSCFTCIRNPGCGCVLDDDMGRRGEGELYRKVTRAHGLFLADPVHGWGPTAMAHLFFERLYPTLWTGELQGMPFASVSVATNQGMQRLAHHNIVKWAFCAGMIYIGGLPVHASYLQEALGEARKIGVRLGEAALKDANEGRHPFASDADRFIAYMGKPWEVLPHYLDNLTNGTMELECSLPARALAEGTFSNPEAAELLEKTKESLALTLTAYRAGDLVEANRLLAKASAYWTHATWKEFLEENVIGAKQPPAYRPLPTEENAR